MFRFEKELQKLIHDKPELVLSGIPEINPELCTDTPMMVSLGREIGLDSGPVDNLFIDTNAILTFVECKRYCDSRIKREVYPQALNYASDLQSRLIHYDGEEFFEQLFLILRRGMDTKYSSIEDVFFALSTDPMIDGKNQIEWKKQFERRLEYNIKSGICRVVILCAPAPNNNFAYRSMRNLMQLMSFSEQAAARYDLILMDLREEFEDQYVSRIVWRRYAALPQIPLLAESTRDTSANIEKNEQLEESYSAPIRQGLEELLSQLSEKGSYVKRDTAGYALYWRDFDKSMYLRLLVRPGHWIVQRHQIRSPEPLFDEINEKRLEGRLSDLRPEIRSKVSSQGDGVMYEVQIEPKLPIDDDQLAEVIIKVLAKRPD